MQILTIDKTCLRVNNGLTWRLIKEEVIDNIAKGVWSPETEITASEGGEILDKGQLKDYFDL